MQLALRPSLFRRSLAALTLALLVMAGADQCENPNPGGPPNRWNTVTAER